MPFDLSAQQSPVRRPYPNFHAAPCPVRASFHGGVRGHGGGAAGGSLVDLAVVYWEVAVA